MSRKPTIKICADPACPLTFTGRGLYCAGHKAGRDKPGSALRKERNREAQRRRRDREWTRKFPILMPAGMRIQPGGSPTTGVSSPLHQADASSQVRGLQTTGRNGHVGRGPDPINVLGTPGMTVTDAIDDFMAAWGCEMR